MSNVKMTYDPTMFELSDNIDRDNFIIATYAYQGKTTTNALKQSFALAVEQSTGTWLPVPEETPEVRKEHVARVCGIYEVPNHSWCIPDDVKERAWIIQIGFPVANFSVQFAMLLTAAVGNISGGGKLKLVDLSFPKCWLEKFEGPKYGVEGVRELLGVKERPLVNNMIKPCCGLTPEVTANIAYEVALGGVDLIKDDELIANAAYSKIEDRVSAVMDALKRADDKKGEKTIYTFNITDTPDQAKRNAEKAIKAGANGLMLNCWTMGLDACREVIKEFDVPFLFHPDLTGSLYVSHDYGLSTELIQAKLPRLAGFDMGIVLSPYGKFPMIEDKFQHVCMTHLAPYHNIKRSLPMPGGGTTQGHIEEVMTKFGTDVVIAAGGAVIGHPDGAVAGGKAFRQGIDIVMNGGHLNDEETVKQYPELKTALDAFGLYEEKKQGIFDLKG